MSELDEISPAPDARLTFRQIVGLDDVEGADWSRLHGHQYALVRDRTMVRVGVNLVAGAVAVWACWGAVPLWLPVMWFAVLGAISFYAARTEGRLVDTANRGVRFEDVLLHARVAGMKGLVWGAGIACFGILGDSQTVYVLWALAALLILASSASPYSAPLSAITFAAGVAAGGVVGALAALDLPLTLIVVATCGIASFGVIENARAALTARLVDFAMQDKSETVSMLLREFEEGQADWLWQIDTHRRLRAVSPRFAFAIGKPASEIEGQSFLQLISGDGWRTGQFPESLHELAEKLKRKQNFSNLLVKTSVAGQARWWELSGTTMVDEKGQYTGFRGVGSDVTEQRESSEKIAFLARYDTLTQLPNRLMLNEALGEALSYAEQWRTRCAFLMIDLDRFKAVNDSLGHLVGDQMLGEVASRLTPLMREGETCGRLGGDEFAVILRDASDKARIETLSEQIIATLSQPYYIENHVLFVGASVGSAIGPRDGRTVEELLRNADLALYRAKDEGGGTHCDYEPQLHANAEEKRQLEFSLRNALEREELELHYQPVVDANDHTIVSFEALVRWNSKDHGFVSPGKFIPLAEDTRLIVPIGTWVMQEACREAAKNWPEDVKVNVNVSPEQLIEPDFAGTVLRALSHSGLAPHRLEIEVTESIFVREGSMARDALEKCMALGCSIALDDFGTGYSSLGYLRKLSFSTIKVDRTFVQGAAQNSMESLAIIRAVVAMADSLGMTTTAEGVENEEEAEMIQRLGCTKIQGFHFGRPMPAGDARKIFRRLAAERARRRA